MIFGKRESNVLVESWSFNSYLDISFFACLKNYYIDDDVWLGASTIDGRINYGSGSGLV